jgi:hypothetical protein
LSRFGEAFGGFMDDWLPSSIEPAKAFERLKVPQVDEFAFGERIATNRAEISAKQLSGAYICVTSLLSTEFSKAADSLKIGKEHYSGRPRSQQRVRERSEVPNTRYGYKFDVYVSYSREADLAEWVQKMLAMLSPKVSGCLGRPVSMFSDFQELSLSSGLYEMVKGSLRSSRTLLAILTPGYARAIGTALEWKTFELREKAIGSSLSLICPILVSGDSEHYPEWVKERAWLQLPGAAAGEAFPSIYSEMVMYKIADRLAQMIRDAPLLNMGWPTVSLNDVEAAVVSPARQPDLWSRNPE